MPWENSKPRVYFRSGKEVVRADGAQERALVSRGTFGPILATVFMDASRGKVHWSRWEEGPSGPMTVFRVVVPKSESHYESSFWSASPMGGVIGATGPTAYHGEIGIDPDTGTILRLVLEADPDLGSPMERADIMVEYGPVVIGGKVYTCPTRSVSILTGESVSRRNRYETESSEQDHPSERRRFQRLPRVSDSDADRALVSAATWKACRNPERNLTLLPYDF